LFHNLLQCQPTVNEDESTISRVDRILSAVTCEMYPAAFRHVFQHGRNRCSLIIQMSEMKSAGLALNDLNGVSLIHCPRKWILARRCRLSDNQKLWDVTALWDTVLSTQKRGESRGI